jgi:hypothetical protein
MVTEIIQYLLEDEEDDYKDVAGVAYAATQESFCKIVKHYAGGRIWHFMLR